MTVCRQRWQVVAGSLVVGALLGTLAARLAHGNNIAVRPRLRDPGHNEPGAYAQLYHDAKTFVDLPAARQQAIRDLHNQLRELPPGPRERLTAVMKRYVEWLEHLPEADRKRIECAPDKQARWEIIQEIRER